MKAPNIVTLEWIPMKYSLVSVARWSGMSRAPFFWDGDGQIHGVPEDDLNTFLKCSKINSNFQHTPGNTSSPMTNRLWSFRTSRLKRMMESTTAMQPSTLLSKLWASMSRDTVVISICWVFKYRLLAAPEITAFEGPSKNLGFEGHDIELKCAATGKPIPLYQWYFEVNITYPMPYNIHSHNASFIIWMRT